MKMFKKLSFDKKLNYEYIYPTTHDAICTIVTKDKDLLEKYGTITIRIQIIYIVYLKRED